MEDEGSNEVVAVEGSGCGDVMSMSEMIEISGSLGAKYNYLLTEQELVSTY